MIIKSENNNKSLVITSHKSVYSLNLPLKYTLSYIENLNGSFRIAVYIINIA